METPYKLRIIDLEIASEEGLIIPDNYRFGECYDLNLNCFHFCIDCSNDQLLLILGPLDKN